MPTLVACCPGRLLRRWPVVQFFVFCLLALETQTPQTLQVANEKLYVNGVAQVEPFINEQPAYTLAKQTVPPGAVSAKHAAVHSQ